MHALLAATAAATLLAVPFVPQREDSCGPAALAMVLRFWGQPVLHDELAADLVDRELHGAAGSRLAEVARRSGLAAVAFRGDARALRESVERGRPVIVAWGLGRGRFHNVVVVGFEGDDPVVHDPARGSGRRIARARFDELWGAADYWTLLVAPSPSS